MDKKHRSMGLRALRPGLKPTALRPSGALVPSTGLPCPRQVNMLETCTP